MTEEKLIEMLIKKYCVRGYPGGDFVYPSDFDRAIHEALAAKGRGCAETWMRDSFIMAEKGYEGIRATSPRYQNILNAEPLEEDV